MNLVIGLLLIVISTYASPSETIGDCKSFCNGVRKEVLAEKGSCAAALKQSQGPNLFNACVEGRKKAFDQTCLPLCAKAKMSITSFDGCQAIARNKGNNFVSWCRKGYESMIQSLKVLRERELMEIVQDTKVEIDEVLDHEAEEKLHGEDLQVQVQKPDPGAEDEMEIASENEESSWTFEVEPVESQPEPDEEEQIDTSTENDLGGGDQEEQALDLEIDYGDAIDEMFSEF
jgi:hypothetical protein